TPIVPGRTHLLVQVLERIRNPQAIPALIAFLENPQQSSQVDQSLQVAVAHALGQFHDERVVAPLLEMLASSNPLIYEVAINALTHSNSRSQKYALLILVEMNAQVMVRAMLEVLHPTESASRSVITTLLLKHPRAAIPPLVNLLDDERAEAAQIILLEFGPIVLPYLVTGLDALNNRAQEHARHIVVTLVQQTPELVHEVVELFNLNPPPRAYEALIDVLTNQLASESVPALLEGLEDAHLIGATSE